LSWLVTSFFPRFCNELRRLLYFLTSFNLEFSKVCKMALKYLYVKISICLLIGSAVMYLL